MNLLLYQSIFILLFCIKYAHNYPSGAPAGTCTSMTPGHGVSSQSCSNNYIIQSDKSQYSSSSDTIRVTVKGSTSSDTFRGILLIAKTATSGQIIGTWSLLSSDTTIQTLTCGRVANTGVTHTDNSDKTSVTAIWTPPSTVYNENTIIRATIVKNFGTFYVNCFSVTLTNLQSNSFSNLIAAAATAIATTTVSTASTPTGNISWTYANGVTSVSMRITNLQTSQWFALGFSLDQSMGEDHVFACKRLSNDTVSIVRLINPSGHNAPQVATLVLSDPGGTFTPTSQKLDNGVISCGFTLSNFASSGRKRRTIGALTQSTTYYPLIAIGNLDSSNGITIHHTTRTALSQTVALGTANTVLYNIASSSSTTTVIATTTTASSAGNGVSISWTYSNGVTTVQMQHSSLQTSQWFALGLSLDQEMGEDHVFACKRLSDDNISVVRLINPSGHNPPQPATSVLSIPGGTFAVTSQKLDNGVVSCVFTLTNLDSTGRKRRAIGALSLTTAYYPLIAVGNLDSSNGITIEHTSRSALSQLVQLNRDETILYNGDESARTGLIKAHGIIMIFVWILLVSTGVLVARYFKSAWPEKKFCSEAIWFAIHRAVMISVAILTIIAFILILVYKNGKWVSRDQSINFAHSIIGIIVVCFAIIQPIMALFRCHPDDEYRFIFNYAHRFVGFSTFILSTIALFLPMFFSDFNFNENKIWGILVAWTCWLPVIFFIFWFIEYYFQRDERNNENSDSYDLGNPSETITELIDENQIKKDRIKLAFLILHIFVAFGLALALAILVGLNIN